MDFHWRKSINLYRERKWKVAELIFLRSIGGDKIDGWPLLSPSLYSSCKPCNQVCFSFSNKIWRIDPRSYPKKKKKRLDKWIGTV